jgi:hypothetical protein
MSDTKLIVAIGILHLVALATGTETCDRAQCPTTGVTATV